MGNVELRARVVRSLPHLHRRVLLANLASGVFWLVLLALLGSWVLALVGAVYVLIASVFLAAVYARGDLAPRREIAAWVAPWIAAVALWTFVGAGIDGSDGEGSGLLLSSWLGFVVGTGTFLAWQLLALALRRGVPT